MENVYFGVKRTEKFFLDKEKEQFIEYKKLNEGEKARYEDAIESKILMHQETKLVEMSTNIGSDRESLVGIAVVGFSIKFGEEGEVKNFTTTEEWKELYSQMDSDKAEELYDAIRAFNGFKKNEELTQQKTK